jgi:ABC-type Co2+ transport system permease subunit
VRRIIKYLVEGLMVAIAAYAIPKRSLNMEEIILIALTAAATFSILDTYVPTMGVTARSGAGFGIGANLVRFPGGF